MRAETQRAGAQDTASGKPSVSAVACPSCHATMTSDMRFCRACGYRLGEGVAEYAETMRLPESEPTKAKDKQPRIWNATVPPVAPMAPMSTFGAQPATQPTGRICDTSISTSGRRKSPHWIVWVLLGLMVSSLFGGAIFRPLRAWREGLRAGPISVSTSPRSMVGATFDDAGGGSGALIQSVSPPGSAADLAGLVGGDIITSLDGQSVTDEDDVTRILRATPVGKTVEVIYTRDGQSRTTTMTTISESEYQRLRAAFAARPQGFLGIDPGDLERVSVPAGVNGANIYGIRMDDVLRNRPAYVAGLRDGDVVVQMDDIPIRTVREFLSRIDRAVPDSIVRFIIMRGGERMEIPVRIGIDD